MFPPERRFRRLFEHFAAENAKSEETDVFYDFLALVFCIDLPLLWKIMVGDILQMLPTLILEVPVFDTLLPMFWLSARCRAARISTIRLS